jgi:hypothetical protein
MTVSLTAIDRSGIKRTAKYSPSSKLGRGGAGTVFRDESDAQYVLKIYNNLLDNGFALKPHGSAPKNEDLRVSAMLAAPPGSQIAAPQNAPNLPWSQRKGAVVQIAWPNETLFDVGGRYVGFSMPVADLNETEPIESLFEIAGRRELAAKFGYGDHTAFNYSYRLNVCRNLATLVQSVHDAGHAICDLNPQNVRIYVKRGLACLIDCDGFRIEAGDAVFPCTKMLDEIAAPEIFAAANGFDPKVGDKRQDLFAFAMLVFRILNDGKSPFHVVARSSNTVPGTVPERIKAGLYGYGLVQSPDVKAAPHSLHAAWPVDLRKYFDFCFAPGNDSRLRPSAKDWQALLAKLTATSKSCTRHGDAARLDGQNCVYCTRDNGKTSTVSLPAVQIAMAPGQPTRATLNRPAPSPARPSDLGSRVIKWSSLGGAGILSLYAYNWLTHPTPIQIANVPTPPPPQQQQRTPEPTKSPPRSSANPSNPLPNTLPAPRKSETPKVPPIPNTQSPVAGTVISPAVTPPLPPASNSQVSQPALATQQAPTVAVESWRTAPTTVPAVSDSPAQRTLIGNLQQQLRTMRVVRDAPSGNLDDRTRSVLAALGAVLSANPSEMELRQAEARLQIASERQAWNIRNADRYLMSSRLPPMAFAMLDEDDMASVAYATSFALNILPVGDRYKHSQNLPNAAIVEVSNRAPVDGEDCKRLDIAISKSGQSWVIKGIRACGSQNMWRLER